MRIKFTVVLFVTGAVLACNGWPRAARLQEEQNKPEKYPTYAATPAEPSAFTFAGRRWMVSPATVQMTGVRLQAVGVAGSTRIYAEQGAATPYAVLYAPAGGTKWRRVLPID